MLPGVDTVLPGLVSVCPGRLGLYSVLMFYVSHQGQGGVIRIGWFRSVPEKKKYSRPFEIMHMSILSVLLCDLWHTKKW